MNDFGKVFLIGAGPGDPGLLTLRGKSVLEKADVIVYDRLVSPAILSLCNINAQMVNVGKMPTFHKVKQSEINKLLVKYAQEMPGKIIARLKGGDPFVFGRGGEEALELVSAGIEFEVVPGVTSAISVPAYAGIPVSHRGIATSFHIITGHEKEEHKRWLVNCNLESQSQGAEKLCKQDSFGDSCISPHSSVSGLDFLALSKCPGTLIFLMGISNMDVIARKLMECGKDPKTPVAFIEKGTTPFQRTVLATLETAGNIIASEHVMAPAITIMGGVVELEKSLAWKKKLPLSGKCLVVTRAAKQSSGISAKLMALGAEVIETSMIEIRSIEPRVGTLDGAAVKFADLVNFDVLAFTSANGVDSFFDALFKAGLDIRVLAGKKIASVGKITEKKLRERGILCDYVPDDHTGEGLGKLLAKIAQSSNLEPGASTLLLQGNLADDTLMSLLPKATRWIVYETLPAKSLPDWKREAVATADAVVFASSSAVENFAKALDIPQNVECATPSIEPRFPILVPRTSFSIGRKTTATANKFGFEVVESDETTMDSLVEKIVQYYTNEVDR